jgi:hypothetical protein
MKFREIGSMQEAAKKGKRGLGQLKGTNSMANKSGRPNKQQPVQFIPDFMGENRHEFVAKLAYTLWEERGRPFGSPEVDWFRAERTVYSSLLASGLITQSANDLEHMAEKIYR